MLNKVSQIEIDVTVDNSLRIGGRNREWLALATLCSAVLIARIDKSVVNLGVHSTGRYFKTYDDSLQWVVDSYNSIYAVFLLTGGLFGDLCGRRRVFICGAAVFTLASPLCAFSPAITVLIVGRALSGFGAALLLPASLAIIRVTWTNPRDHNKHWVSGLLVNVLLLFVARTWAAC